MDLTTESSGQNLSQRRAEVVGVVSTVRAEGAERIGRVLLILERPTPHRDPTLDELARLGVDLEALYHSIQDSERGWGDTGRDHRSYELPAGAIASIASVVRRVVNPRVRVVCCFGYRRPTNIAAILVARLRGLPIVTRSDSNWQYEAARGELRLRLKRIALHAVFGKNARVWTIGSNNEEYWKAFGFNNRHLIPYEVPKPPIGTSAQGEELRRLYRLGPGPTFLYVGRLEPMKGVDILIEAFRGISECTARLLIVGHGSCRRDLDDLVGDDGRIHFLGALPQAKLGAVYAASDVLVLPSRREAWGLVVNEAQANGLRVIVSDAVGSATDLVDAKSGWIFPTGESAALGRAMLEAIEAKAGGWEAFSRPSSTIRVADAMLQDLRRITAP